VLSILGTNTNAQILSNTFRNFEGEIEVDSPVILSATSGVIGGITIQSNTFLNILGYYSISGTCANCSILSNKFEYVEEDIINLTGVSGTVQVNSNCFQNITSTLSDADNLAISVTGLPLGGTKLIINSNVLWNISDNISATRVIGFSNIGMVRIYQNYVDALPKSGGLGQDTLEYIVYASDCSSDNLATFNTFLATSVNQVISCNSFNMNVTDNKHYGTVEDSPAWGCEGNISGNKIEAIPDPAPLAPPCST